MRAYCNDCDINQTVVLANERTQTCPNCGKPLAVQSQSRIDADSETQLGGVEDFDIGIPEEPPQRIGKYRIVSHVATGGFGSVFKGYDGMLDQHVAIKIPRKDKLDAGSEEEFIREARTMAKLEHPHIVAIKEAGRDQGTGSVFLAMKWIEGPTLAQLAKDEIVDIAKSVAIIEKIADGVGFAHQQGFVHRDLKPSNILIDANGEPFVTDFGLAIEYRDGKLNAGNLNAGTLPYMSPEQFNTVEQEIDHRTDIWSLGVIFYQLLTGHRPFAGKATEISESIRSQNPKPLRVFNAKLPKRYEFACLKCLAKNPEKRFQTVGEFRRMLAKKSQLGRRTLVGVGAVAVLGVAGWQFRKFLFPEQVERLEPILSKPTNQQRLLIGNEDQLSVQRHMITIDVQQSVLLQLGTVDEGNYVFEIDIESDHWGPNVGMFFGLIDRQALALTMRVTRTQDVELSRIMIRRSEQNSVTISRSLNHKKYGSLKDIDTIRFRCMFRGGILRDYGAPNVPRRRMDGKIERLEGDDADGDFMVSNTKSCGGAFGIFARPQQKLVIKNLKINGKLQTFKLTRTENR